jgi:hypothetical protein
LVAPRAGVVPTAAAWGGMARRDDLRAELTKINSDDVLH